jgi:hypothetical protein
VVLPSCDQAELALYLARLSTPGLKAASLLWLEVPVAIGSRRSAWKGALAGALAAGAGENGVAAVLLAIAPVAGLGRVAGGA